MTGSDDICTPESVSQQPGGNGIRSLDSKQEEAAAVVDHQPPEDTTAHVAAAADLSDVPVPSLSAPSEPGESQQVEASSTVPPQQSQDSRGTEVAPDSKNEPVRTQSKHSANLQPTAALVYPWISASMRRSGTGTASFRTAAGGQYAGMPPSAMKATHSKRVPDKDGTQASNTPVSTPSPAASPQVPPESDPAAEPDSVPTVPQSIAGIEAAVQFEGENQDSHISTALPSHVTPADLSATMQPDVGVGVPPESEPAGEPAGEPAVEQDSTAMSSLQVHPTNVAAEAVGSTDPDAAIAADDSAAEPAAEQLAVAAAADAAALLGKQGDAGDSVDEPVGHVSEAELPECEPEAAGEFAAPDAPTADAADAAADSTPADAESAGEAVAVVSTDAAEPAEAAAVEAAPDAEGGVVAEHVSAPVPAEGTTGADASCKKAGDAMVAAEPAAVEPPAEAEVAEIDAPGESNLLSLEASGLEVDADPTACIVPASEAGADTAAQAVLTDGEQASQERVSSAEEESVPVDGGSVVPPGGDAENLLILDPVTEALPEQNAPEASMPEVTGEPHLEESDLGDGGQDEEEVGRGEADSAQELGQGDVGAEEEAFPVEGPPETAVAAADAIETVTVPAEHDAVEGEGEGEEQAGVVGDVGSTTTKPADHSEVEAAAGDVSMGEDDKQVNALPATTELTSPETATAEPVEGEGEEHVGEGKGKEVGEADPDTAAGDLQASIYLDINAAGGSDIIDPEAYIEGNTTRHIFAPDTAGAAGTATADNSAVPIQVGALSEGSTALDSPGQRGDVGPAAVSADGPNTARTLDGTQESNGDEVEEGEQLGEKGGDADMHDDAPVAAPQLSSPDGEADRTAPHGQHVAGEVPNGSNSITGDRKAEKDSPSRPAAPRELAPAATNCQHPDLCALSSHILSETQSQSQKPFKVSLNWAKLGLAATLEGMATAHSTAQQSGKVWPVKADGKEPTVMHYNVNSLYQLGECPSGAAVCTFEVRGFGGDESGVAGNEVVGAKDDAEAAEHNVTLSEGTFVLAKEDCLIFSESCSSLQLSMITFQGGVVVLNGAGCNVDFEKVVFEDTMLVVMNGAKAKLSSCRFLAEREHSEHIQLYIHGGNSHVQLTDCNLDGGKQGIAVHHGAVLDAKNTHCTSIAILGIEVRDANSSATLSYCSVHDTGAPLEYPDSRFTYGVVVQAGATANLTECSIDGGGRGLVVALGLMRETPPLGSIPNTDRLPTGSPAALSPAQHAHHASGAAATPLHTRVKATRCGFKYTVDCCVYCEDSAVLKLVECDVEGSRMMHGLWVSNKAVVAADKTMFVGNAQDGVFVCAGGQVTATQCDTEGNRSSGFKVSFGGAKLTAIDCSSTGEPVACEVSKHGSSILVEKMSVEDCRGCAFDVSDGATADLQGCVVNSSTFSCVTVRAPAEVKMTQCVLEGGYKGHGMLVEGNGAVVEASECRFKNNGISGVAVGNEAQVKLMQCATESNKASGFQAAFKGQLFLSDCSCDGDTDGCVTTGEGTKLVAENVVVRAEGFGFLANVSSRMTLKGCLAEQCKQAGFCVEKKSRLKMVECKSIGNLSGCNAMRGGSVVTAVDTLFISNKEWGVDVADGAQAEFQGCTISKCAKHCMRVHASAVTLVGCILERSETSHGLQITNSSTAEITECKFVENKSKGVFVGSKAEVTMQECETRGNGTGGCWVESAGILSVLNSLSNEDTLGLGVSEPGSQLTCDKVNVICSVTQGFLALGGAKAELRECIALECGGDGVSVVESGSELQMHGGRIENNGGIGVGVRNGATGMLHEVSSGGNKEAGFGSCGQGSLLNAFECVSSDATPFVKQSGGRIDTRGGKQVDPVSGVVESRAGGLHKWKDVAERK